MGTGMTTTMNTITPMANEDAVAIATDFFHCESSSTRVWRLGWAGGCFTSGFANKRTRLCAWLLRMNSYG